MSSGRTGPNFSLPKSWQKPPKDVPSFGNLPDREPQAKARESDARFRSPALSVQIWKQSRDEPVLRHCSSLARIKIHCQNSAHCECNGQYGSSKERSDTNRRCTALRQGIFKGRIPLNVFCILFHMEKYRPVRPKRKN